ncbi:hypothetical protein RhiirC2_719523 [Rhizophagus irregularis]|uniref:Uncharacterized protein n=1 Tax=Rhizophagus irregularis TaxID=588596 RepID=A0A2N1MDZ8_9GLOM|nr:hypothetical protein RhiirC2_719523 [Rhizophagus irregularis]
MNQLIFWGKVVLLQSPFSEKYAQDDLIKFFLILAEDPDNLRILLSRCLLNTIWASETLRVLWGSPLKINNKNVKGFLTALFKYLPPERKSHIMHHGFNVTRCKIEDFEDLAMKISYLYISMPKDVIDYLNGVMKHYSKNSSEFQYIKKGLKCRERCNLLELAKRDSCL